MLLPIREYVEVHKASSIPLNTEDFRAAGYFEKMFFKRRHFKDDWAEMHQWCRNVFGDNYTWCGGHFFFQTIDDALLYETYWGERQTEMYDWLLENNFPTDMSWTTNQKMFFKMRWS